METVLTAIEARILGSLVEKEMTTPEYYPLSVNSLVLACNQKSNRDPVTELTEGHVSAALSSLSRKQFVVLAADSGRVAKWRHLVFGKLGLSGAPLAVLAELLLRGPQTPGELKTRASRMAEIPELASVITVINELENTVPPLIVRLPKQAGRKEHRYAQLLTGEPGVERSPSVPASPYAEPSPVWSGPDALADRETVAISSFGPMSLPVAFLSPDAESRIARLEEEVAYLKMEVEELKKSVGRPEPGA